MSLLPIIKQAAMDAVDATNPCDILTGTVINNSPLEVRVDSSLILRASDGVLEIAESLMEKEIKIPLNLQLTAEAVEFIPEGEADVTAFASHSHPINSVSEELTIKISDGVQIGDKVILIRKAGGQRFYVIDRLVSA